MKPGFIILGAILVVALAFLLCQDAEREQPRTPPQPREGNNTLLPGEVNDPLWPRPIVVSALDTVCSDRGVCPSRGADCVTRDFKVEMDTTYYLTTMFFNGDTLTASCRACGTVLQGNQMVMSQLTACPTGGPWVTSARLVPGIVYTVAICLRPCPDVTPPCNCGTAATADAIVSMRRVF